MEKALLIDGSSLIFRAFYAIRNLSTKDGIPTNGVYGFLSMYFRMIEEYEPDYVLVAFDRDSKTFRKEDYEDYKAGREKAPSELSLQFGMLQDVLDAMNVAHIDLGGYEADDIIGTLSVRLSDLGIESMVVTGDKDFLQLVNENTKVSLTRKGISQVELFDLEKIREEYNLEPKQLIDVKGLMGDSSDNIPGVPGIGEKTALSLIKDFGSIDGVYENIDKISGKARVENLKSNKAQAYMSRELGEIVLNVPLDIQLEDIEVKEMGEEKSREIFEKLELRSFMKYLPDQEISQSSETKVEFLLEEDLDKLIDKIEEVKSFSFKFFYDDDNYVHSEVAAFAIKLRGEDTAYINIYNDDFYIRDSLRNGRLKEVFENPGIEKLTFDIKPDIFYLMGLGIEIENFNDNMLAEYLIDPSQRTYTIASQAQTRLNIVMKSLDDLRGKGAKRKLVSEIEGDEFCYYVKEFLTVTEGVYPILKEVLEERKMTSLYEDIELPLTEVLASMELAGLEIDMSIFDKISKKIEVKIDVLESRIYEMAGRDFNINSPKQLGEVLFEELDLPVIKKTKTGYSTDASVLEKLQGKHEIIDYITEYRSVVKLKSTYVDAMPPYISEDGRMRTTFKQNVTVTGRISSQDPNLQNIPIRTEEGRMIRKAFVAGEDKVFIDADYSQIELRVLAHLSQDEVMIQAFKEGKDIHTMTASQVFNVPLEDVDENQRSAAKAVNFGIVYGVSDYGLSQNLNISRKEAESYINSYKETYPGIARYMEEIVEQGKEDGYVDTLLNRRRYIPELKNSNRNIRSFGERVALNTPIQGTAADIIKIAMVDVYEELKTRGLESKLVLQVHDELMIEAPVEEANEVEGLLKKIMESAIDLDVDITVDISRGETWYDA